MKLVILMFLEDDKDGVEQLLAARGVSAYSDLPVEGHGAGTAGWYGKVAPYRSQMSMVLLPGEAARELVDAVEKCAGCKDARHPIHAWVVDVERAVVSGAPASAS
jgi:hypothetical protein